MEQHSIEHRLAELENAVSAITERNQRVELEKQWEQSTTRVIVIVVLTYVLMSVVFYMIGAENFLINAIIPTLGYFLSTQSLSVLKNHWIDRRKRD